MVRQRARKTSHAKHHHGAQAERCEQRVLLTTIAQYDAALKANIDSISANSWTPSKIAGQFTNHTNTPKSNGLHIDIASFIAAEAELYSRNPATNSAYASSVMTTLQGFVNDWKGDTSNGTVIWQVDTGFFFAEPIFSATKVMLDHGNLLPSSQLAIDLKEMAKDIARPYNEVGAHNRTASAAMGVAEALKCFPDINTDTKFPTGYTTFREYVDLIWIKITGLGDSWDNAVNYNNIYLGDVLRLAEYEGQLSLLGSDSVLRNMFTRQRDSLSPAGNLPCYGDDYAGFGGPDRYLAVFESIATLYNDGTFKWAADKYYANKTSFGNHWGLWYLGMAINHGWVSDAISPVQPVLSSQMLKRAISYTNPQEDMLVLTPSRDLGQPFVASTGLWAVVPGNNHMHTAQMGAITLFESQGTTFLRAMGYHNERPEHASQVVISADGNSFPYTDPIPAGFTTQTNLGIRPSLLDSKVTATLNGDQYGMIKQGAFYSSGATNTRRMVLLSEGIFVVFDKVVPDAALNGQSAGPVWQLAGNGSTSISTTTGSDWVDGVNFLNNTGSAHTTTHLLIKTDKPTGRDIGARTPPAGYYADGFSTNTRAAYAADVLQTGVSSGFLSVLMPHAAASSAGALAGDILIQKQSADAGKVQFHSSDGTLIVVAFNADGSWSVLRIPPGIVVPTPLASYRFEEGAGTTAIDATGHGFAGTISGASYDSGQIGGGLSFNGTTSSVSLGNPAGLDVVGQITLSAWVKPSATDSFRNIVGRSYSSSPSRETVLRINAGKYEIVTWNGTTYSASMTIPSGDVGAWIHLCGVYDGSAWKLYRNGVLGASTTAGVGAVSVAKNWRIGSGDGVGRYFAGSIDEVRIFATALNDAQVAALSQQSGPLVALSAFANPNPVTGVTANLGVLGQDLAGESGISYSWSLFGAAPAPVTFTSNGSNSAKNTVVQFTRSGSYVLRATLTNALGFFSTSDVAINVTFGFAGYTLAAGALFDFTTADSGTTFIAHARQGQATVTSDLASGGKTVSLDASSGASVIFDSSQSLAGLSIASGGLVKFSGGAGKVLTTSSFTSAGQLDLADNAMILRTSDAGSTTRNTLWQKIIDGRNGVDGSGFANWNGLGIISSTARAANTAALRDLYTIGIISNHDLTSPNRYGPTNPWLGSLGSVGMNDVLIRYTYNGDTNLDGIITIVDYVAIDSTYGGTASNLGWVSGDFNNDGAIGIEDYVAIDTAYAFQNGPIGQALSAAGVALSGASKVVSTAPPTNNSKTLHALVMPVNQHARRNHTRPVAGAHLAKIR